MLDLALGCHLKTAEASDHDAIKARHKAIKTLGDAAIYIREVEGRIHSRRRFKPPQAASGQAARGAPVALPAKPSRRSKLSSWGTPLLVVLLFVGGWNLPAGLSLIWVTLGLVVTMAALGKTITGRPAGILVNERNLMSLSRFQMALWTVVVLAAYLTFALVRIKALGNGLPNGLPVTDALNIQIDWHLWTLIGISASTLVGSPLLLGLKQDQQPDSSVMRKTAATLAEPEAEIVANKQGVLYANSKMSDACFTDMFQGDELANTAHVDLAKVQMFFFTIIAAFCFLVMVFNVLTTGKTDLSSLPLLPDGFVAVLGISHTGYLASKTINHTKSTS